MKITAYLVLIFYCWSYNTYFGNNWLPKSGEEAICDGIAMLIFIFILLSNPND